MQQRNISLDALRGFAILAMVLSSSIAFGILPAWMYHAQVPPPAHRYDPTLPGISWVDLVFPFFLFSMGAAIPLSLQKKISQGGGFWQVLYIAARRFVLLAFFALFTVHLRAGMQSASPQTTHHLLAIFAFVLLFFQFYEPAGLQNKKLFAVIRAFAFGVAALLLYLLPFKDNQGFSWNRIDIIILVLANMAFFGTLTWWLTRNHAWIRIGLLPFIMAVFLGGKEAGSWNETLLNWSPLPALYKFYYLKYLFIIIPASFAGEWLLRYANEPESQKDRAGWRNLLTLLLSFAMVVANTALLFAQYYFISLVLTGILAVAIHYCLAKCGKHKMLHLFFLAGTYLLLLGLFLNAWEGGIKKDPSTYSYYFVTSGMAFFMLIGWHGLQHSGTGESIVKFFASNGRNPMVAYVAGNLLLLPLLHSTGGIRLLNLMESNAWLGLVRGLLFTAIVSLVTVYFTKKKWFWKT